MCLQATRSRKKSPGPGSSTSVTRPWPCTLLNIHGNSVVVNGENGTRRGHEIPEDIEGFWAFTRQWLKHYRGVPRMYFPLYLKEIEWRFNHRSENLVKLIRNHPGPEGHRRIGASAALRARTTQRLNRHGHAIQHDQAHPQSAITTVSPIGISKEEDNG